MSITTVLDSLTPELLLAFGCLGEWPYAPYFHIQYQSVLYFIGIYTTTE